MPGRDRSGTWSRKVFFSLEFDGPSDDECMKASHTRCKEPEACDCGCHMNSRRGGEGAQKLGRLWLRVPFLGGYDLTPWYYPEVSWDNEIAKSHEGQEKLYDIVDRISGKKLIIDLRHQSHGDPDPDFT